MVPAMRYLILYTVLIPIFTTVTSFSLHPLYQRWDSAKWGIIWAAAPQLVEPNNLPPPPFNSIAIFPNATLRQTIKVYQDTGQLRLRLSNAFGLTPLTINNVAIALPINGSAGVNRILAKTSTKLTFSGSESVSIPKGALAVSDPIDFKVRGNQIIAVTVYLSAGQSGSAVTGHPGSRTDSWVAIGNQVASEGLTGTELTSTAHWYFISGLEGKVSPQAKTLSIIGDSITDGRASTTNANNRWPDFLFTHLQSTTLTSHISIANQGLGGNCILSECLGPNALSRIDRDIIAQPSIGYGMIFEGVNDIGSAPSDPTSQKAVGDALIAAFKQFSIRVKAARLPVFVGTITPFGGSGYDDPAGERGRTRVRVNEWLRRSGIFDVVVDFDKAVRDSNNFTRLRIDFDSGDGLHPNVMGFGAMAKAVPLDVFR